ncbi:hypothetical protein WJX79_004717 [Trebouxia sp. C0005]
MDTASSQSDWQVGRATFYGTDGWSIHQGSCGFYYIFQSEPLGWDVAAMSDANPLYPGSCGSCFEVKCNPISFTDGNGQEYDRTSACYNPDQSVVFRITDTCPCNYAANAASNKRWCCGDMTHYDMSIWAFEKLADTKWGVIGLQWRPVPCDYNSTDPAPTPANPVVGQEPPPGTQYPPAGYWDKPRSQWPGNTGSLEGDEDTSANLPGPIYNQTLLNNWTAQSYNSTLYQNASAMGAGELIIQCSSISPNGSLVFTAPGQGYFLGKLSMSFWAQYTTSTPDLQLSLASTDDTLPQGSCSDLILADLTPLASAALVPLDMLSYTVYLGAFQNSSTHAGPNALSFQGCPGVSPESIDQIVFSNTGDVPQQLCLDNLVLLDGNAVLLLSAYRPV